MTAKLEFHRGMPALAEVVFELAADPDHLQDWLPQEQADAERETQDYSVDIGSRTATWGNKAYSGRLSVHETDGATSEIRMELEFTGEVPADARDVVESSLDRLAEQVGSRANDAS